MVPEVEPLVLPDEPCIPPLVRPRWPPEVWPRPRDRPEVELPDVLMLPDVLISPDVELPEVLPMLPDVLPMLPEVEPPEVELPEVLMLPEVEPLVLEPEVEPLVLPIVLPLVEPLVEPPVVCA